MPEHRLARAELGELRIVAYLMRVIHAFCAKPVQSGQHIAFHCQRGDFQLVPLGQLLGLAEADPEHPRRTKTRAADIAFPAPILDFKNLFQPRLHVLRFQVRLDFESNVALLVQTAHSLIHGLAMCTRKVFYKAIPITTDPNTGNRILLMCCITHAITIAGLNEGPPSWRTPRGPGAAAAAPVAHMASNGSPHPRRCSVSGRI